jgi:UDP-2,4-diacetamido-2,4,6-trideoxy-beta-L-altropyranose hydrolase
MGIGHLSRCLTLAETLRTRGMQPQFICRPHAGHLMSRIDDEGLRVTALRAPLPGMANLADDYATWLGVTQDEDAAETSAALAGEELEWIVSDHYALDARWETQLRARAQHLMVIDDLANRSHACDVLLDQNFHPMANERYAGLVPASCRLMTGPRYALLRPEYAQHRCGHPPIRDGLRRIFIFFGGSDPHNLTGAALEALSRPSLRHLMVDVVVGVNNPHRRELATQVSERPNAALYGSMAHIAGLLSRADLAIGAAGTTTWERMCLGVPSLVVCIAENQRFGAEALAREGMILCLGTQRDAGVENFASAMERVVAGEEDLSGQALRCWLAVDGLGAMRVAECLDPTEPQGLRLREAQPDDAGLFFGWANDPQVRRQSLNTQTIPWTAHRPWFAARIADERSRLFVLEARSLPVGQIRFDIEAGEVRISYSLDAQFRGRGWARILVGLGMSRMAALGRMVFRAELKKTNTASAAVFRRLGFLESPFADREDITVFRFDNGSGNNSYAN